MKKRILASAMMAMITIGCATTDLGTLNLQPNGETAAIILKIDSTPATAQKYIIHSYEPSTAGDKIEKYKDSKALYLTNTKDGFLFSTLKPGHYYINELVQQEQWSLCFHASTYAFEVKPDTVNYIGQLDPRSNIAQLQATVIRERDQNAREYNHYYYTDNILPPGLLTARENDRRDAEEYLKLNAPGVGLPVVSSPITEARYKPNLDIRGNPKTC
ncbi:MAG: hypothetical protein ABJ275_02695 [Maricaulaceae bacterium]